MIERLRQQLRSGLEAAANEAAEIYRTEASAKVVPPRSSPGEYPAVETGQGLANIASGLDPEPLALRARMGVYGAQSPIAERDRPSRQRRGGMHMWWVKTRYGRKFADDIIVENKGQIAEAFKRGAR